MRGVAGLRVLVTGAGRGIGRAVAERLIDENARVVAADLEAPDIGEVSLSGDMTSESDVARIVETTLARMQGIDGLVTCAGIHYVGPTHETTPEDFRRVIDVNLNGTFLAMRAVIPTMLQAGSGRIVTLGSTASLVAGPTLAAYAAAKGGVLQLTRSVAAEYASRGIRANCLCPGATNTPMLAELMRDRDNPDAFAKAHPIGRFAEPEEIAGAVAYLLSDDASFMVGSAVAFDGGFTAV